MPERQTIRVSTEPGLWPPTWPMGLTMLRLVLLPVFLWALLLDSNQAPRRHWWVAVAIYFVMAITDKLDGYLARRLQQTSKLGAILDPVADKILVACSVMLLSFDWIAPRHFTIPWWVVLAVYGKDLIIVTGTIVLLAVVGKVTIVARPLGKISTLLQLSMVLAVLIAPDEAARWMAGWRVFVYVLWWLVTAVAALSCIDYVVQGVLQFSRARRGEGEAAAPNAVTDAAR